MPPIIALHVSSLPPLDVAIPLFIQKGVFLKARLIVYPGSTLSLNQTVLPHYFEAYSTEISILKRKMWKDWADADIDITYIDR